jgi:DNA integrity scanning protein DisA with diadenylate cyclase activity
MVKESRGGMISGGGNKSGQGLIPLAARAVRELEAEAMLILPERPQDWREVRSATSELRVIVGSDSEKLVEAARGAGLLGVELEPIKTSVYELITSGLLQAVSEELIPSGARVVVVYSGFESEVLDSITVVRLGEHLERLTARDLRALETSVPLETLKAVVDLAVEIGREGREGKAVGTLIVVGDTREVLARTRTLGFDPFKGYRRKDRNLRDSRVREAIKEIAQLDGGFVVSRDGTVEAACQIVDAPMTGLVLPKGLGTRHWAAAAITKVTDAIAVVVSQSTGTVRVFQEGEIVLRIAPMRHVRAMKWKDDEAEPPTITRTEKQRDGARDGER